MDTDFQSELAARVARDQARYRVPGLTVIVGVDGVQLAAASAGFADVADRIPATSTTAYRIGSITKTFIAAATLSLCSQGALSLDTPIGRFLPGLHFADLPLRTVLSHSSGLQREVPGPMWESMQGPSATELMAALVDVELVAAPGERWHYSNLGYALLGQIIERVVDQPYETLIDRTLLRPLNLTHTRWTPPADAAIGYRLDPYAEAVDREPMMDQAAVGAAGELWSTGEDLVRWGHALCGGAPDVVPPKVVDAMHRVQIMVDTASWKRGWGLGLILDRHDDHVLAGHTGAMPGFQTALTLDRATNTVVAVLANATRSMNLATLAAEVTAAAIAAQPAPPPEVWTPAPPCPPEVTELLGSWWTESDETVFTWRHDGLHAHLASDPAATDTRFVQEAPGRFRAAAGRFHGELLLATHANGNVELRWATYPLTRTTR
ncbi:serine hydrolase domain-containing protein [Nocardia jiangxiensis]|uniref:Serine hydrolase domain-containing protein n=1 Tax=Nocardia jiangxiensis TaxID=282685 RepID=A0ABW6S0W9_9NOCA